MTFSLLEGSENVHMGELLCPQSQDFAIKGDDSTEVCSHTECDQCLHLALLPCAGMSQILCI